MRWGFQAGSKDVGRLAPSPTGALHVGHARTFLIAWLMARQSGGRVIMRIEDIDASRVRPGMADLALTDLRWLGLDWDEGPDLGGPSAPYVQSERLALFAEALDRLKRADLVYPCTCTRAEIQRAASAPHAGEEGPIYPGTCAGRSAAEADSLGDRRFAWRFRVDPAPIVWDDLFRGRIEADPLSSGGDFVVGRSDGGPSYQLAVVVDDAAMGVSQVIRGDDLVSSTPRQILLDQSLSLSPPRFGHVPLALTPDGRRLAKRDESIKLATLREQNIAPRHLIGWLARSIGIALAPDEPASPSSLIGRFDPSSLPPDPLIVSPEAIDMLRNRRQGF